MYAELRIWRILLRVGIEMVERPKPPEPEPERRKAGFRPNE